MLLTTNKPKLYRAIQKFHFNFWFHSQWICKMKEEEKKKRQKSKIDRKAGKARKDIFFWKCMWMRMVKFYWEMDWMKTGFYPIRREKSIYPIQICNYKYLDTYIQIHIYTYIFALHRMCAFLRFLSKSIFRNSPLSSLHNANAYIDFIQILNM